MTTVLDLLKEQGFQKGFEEGFQQGFEEGLQQGFKEGLPKGIEKLLSKEAVSLREIASALEVDLAWVEEIARKMPRQGSRIR